MNDVSPPCALIIVVKQSLAFSSLRNVYIRVELLWFIILCVSGTTKADHKDRDSEDIYPQPPNNWSIQFVFQSVGATLRCPFLETYLGEYAVYECRYLVTHVRLSAFQWLFDVHVEICVKHDRHKHRLKNSAS